MALDANGHPVSRISQRKLEHLKLSLEASVQSTRTAGFDRFCFTHQALPELDLDAIDTSTTFLNKPLKLPFLISSMTGGAHAAGDINRRLALVAQSVGIAFGVGSQRAGLTHKDLRATYQVRSVAPDRASAVATLFRLPLTRVMSDASIAISVPVPIAIPRSACASAGASLTPSPTNATLRPNAWRRFTSSTFPSGAWT